MSQKNTEENNKLANSLLLTEGMKVWNDKNTWKWGEKQFLCRLSLGAVAEKKDYSVFWEKILIGQSAPKPGLTS